MKHGNDYFNWFENIFKRISNYFLPRRESVSLFYVLMIEAAEIDYKARGMARNNVVQYCNKPDVIFE